MPWVEDEPAAVTGGRFLDDAPAGGQWLDGPIKEANVSAYETELNREFQRLQRTPIPLSDFDRGSIGALRSGVKRAQQIAPVILGKETSRLKTSQGFDPPESVKRQALEDVYGPGFKDTIGKLDRTPDPERKADALHEAYQQRLHDLTQKRNAMLDVWSSAAEDMEREIRAIPKTQAQQELAKARTQRDKWSVFRKFPVQVTSSIVLESLPPSIAGAIVGAPGGPAGMAVGVGLGGGSMEYANTLLSEAGKAGFDVSQPGHLVAFLDSPAYDAAADKALARSSIIAGVDMATAGMAGTFIKPALKEGLRQRAVAIGKETGLQAAGGAAGEFLAQTTTEQGQPYDWFDVAMEAAGEAVSAVPEAGVRIGSDFINERIQAAEPAGGRWVDDLPPESGEQTGRPAGRQSVAPPAPAADTSPAALSELQAMLRGEAPGSERLKGAIVPKAPEKASPPSPGGEGRGEGGPRTVIAAQPTEEMRAALEFQRATDEAVRKQLENPDKDYSGMSRLELELLEGMGDAGALAERRRRRSAKFEVGSEKAEQPLPSPLSPQTSQKEVTPNETQRQKEGVLETRQPIDFAPEAAPSLPMPSSKPNPFRALLERYEASEQMTVRDLIDEVAALPRRPAPLNKAIRQFEDARRSDRDEFGDRSGLTEDAETAFLDALEKAAGQGVPAQQGKPAPPQTLDLSPIKSASLETLDRIGGALAMKATSSQELKGIGEAMREREAELKASPKTVIRDKPAEQVATVATPATTLPTPAQTFKRGERVFVRKKAHLSKTHPATVIRDDGAEVLVRYQRSKLYETLPKAQVNEASSKTARRAYEQQFAGQDDAQRRQSKAAAREFNKLVVDYGPVTGWYDPQHEAAENQEQRMQRDTAKRKAVERAMRAIGVPENEVQANDALLAAKWLPKLKEYLAGGQFALNEPGEFSFDAPESVAEQKARQEREAKAKADAETLAEKKAFVARGGDRLVGNTDEQTQDLFGGTEQRETRRDSSGQGSLFARPAGWEEMDTVAEGSPRYGMEDEDIADRLAARRLTDTENIRVVSGGTRWAMRLRPDGIIEINREGVRAEAFEHDLDHELSHLADRDPEVRAAATAFVEALTPEERAAVDAWLGRGYGSEARSSETRAEALNQLRQREQAWSAWQRLVKAIAAWWRRVTGQKASSDDVARVASALIARAEGDVRQQRLAGLPGAIPFQGGVLVPPGSNAAAQAITAHHEYALNPEFERRFDELQEQGVKWARQSREARNAIREARARGEQPSQEMLDRLQEAELGLIDVEDQLRSAGATRPGSRAAVDENLEERRPRASREPGRPEPSRIPQWKGEERLPGGRLRDLFTGLRRWRERAGNWLARGAARMDITVGRDAADNRAAQAANQASLRVRLILNRAFNTAPGEVRTKHDMREAALTFVVEADGDRGVLGDFYDQIAASDNAGSKAGRQAMAAIEYAEAHWDQLQSAAAEYRTLTETEREAELNEGVNSNEWQGGYVYHRWAKDAPAGGADPTKSTPSGTPFGKPRSVATYAEGIAKGRKPTTLNALELLAERVAAGQRRMNELSWVHGLRNLLDPVTDEPVVVDVIKKPRRPAGLASPSPGGEGRGEGGPTDFAEGYKPEWLSIAPEGYHLWRLGDLEVAVQEGFGGLLSKLTAPSFFKGAGAKKVFGFIKSALLMFDTFHLGRMVAWRQMFGLFGGYQKGQTLLDFSTADIREMAQRGEIPESWTDGLLENKRRLDMAVRTGFNVGNVLDNAWGDVLHHLPGIGTFNKWLFGQYQRGAMAEAWLIEFERMSRALPKQSEAAVARRVSRNLNARFGNLNRQGLFKSRTAQDLARFVFLAPQWNESLIRSEVGAIGQALKLPVESVQQRRIVVGTLLRATGLMAAGTFLANQILNYAFRGKPTWENDEEGFDKKISAWIPDAISGGPGFFLNPLALPMEYTHLIEGNLHRSGGDWSEAFLRIFNSRLHSISRAGSIFVSRRDVLGQKLREGEVLPAMAKAMIPAPIASGTVISAGKQLATGEPSEQFPGQYQKQLMSSFGVKTDQAPNAEQRIRNLARSFNKDKGIVPSAEFFAGDFDDLNKSLRIGNMSDAREALDDLLKKKTPRQVYDHYKAAAAAPFTGQRGRESEFWRGLTAEQRATYLKARESRRATALKAAELLRNSLSPAAR